MPDKHFFTSLTRISDLEERGYSIRPLERREWETGDYVLGEVLTRPSALARIETATGRMVDMVEGDRIVGALGIRSATLEAVGDWRHIGPDGRMHALTSAGLFGKLLSVQPLFPPLMALGYLGHVVRGGVKLRMRDFVAKPEPIHYEVPTLLIIGTSMSAGKTTTAKVIIRILKRAGLRVAGVKLTGAGRYRDVLGMRDAGADAIFDFVDVGLPSTIVPHEEYRLALRDLLSLVASADPDIVVAEAGASPLEPYNGDVAMEELDGTVRLTVLCASDPYSVVGVMKGFGYAPDLVAGLCTSTSAGVLLVERLTGLPALNLLHHGSVDQATKMLRDRFAF